MASAALRDEETCCICTDIYTDPVTLPCAHSFCRFCIIRTWENQEEREFSCPDCRRRFRLPVMASAALRDVVTCSICRDIYMDPVTLPCAHSFCRLCITRTWDNQEERDFSCPECRRRFRVRPELNRALRLSNILERLRYTHPEQEVGITCTYCIQFPVPALKTCLLCEVSLCEDHLRVHNKSAEHILIEPTASLENRECSVHKKVLEYYCCEDAACICVSCSLAGEHRGHRVETLNEASKKKKKKLRNILKKLTSQREEAEKRVQSLEELRRQVQEKAAGIINGITALIRDITKQPETPEKRVLSEISRQEEQISLRVSDLIRQLKIKKEELSRKMGDIEELCNMTDPLTVLQGRESDRADYCDAERHDIKVHDVGELIKVTLYSGLVGIVTAVTRRCRVLEASDMLLDVNTASDMLLDVIKASDMLLGVNTASDMLLDVNTASNSVSVSDGLKTVSWSEMTQSRPETPERFQEFHQVLSCRSFSSGRHYWEVEGSESGWWVVGMTYPNIERRGDQSAIGINSMSWGLGRGWFNNQYSVIHDSKLIQLPHPSSCRRLGILLDYEAGRLSFYELCNPIRHLHTFTAAFTEPLHAVFGVYGNNSWVRI